MENDSNTSDKPTDVEPINNDAMEVDEEMDEFDDNEDAPINNAMLFQTDEKTQEQETSENNKGKDKLFDLPEFTRKDKTLDEILNLMEDNPPIIPDTVINYYLMKNGFDCADLRVKRLLALATQKFVSDIAADAYEYSRIRSSVAVHNANNGQSRARQLMLGQQQPQSVQPQSTEKGVQGKVVLTVNDLSSAVSEYGLNIARPDFYR
ncbi:hypothetical protein NCAS_0B03310 [Naumovozyma castellii]|uniref:Transcription initiation factor TFIID subunit 10 n=1 Tax=Naumovozyma castellii TaxID=27288 RepID=G0VBT9_NAUCA|nr:hypothetical protein NCAS_0B03310 [Naumovozyma castellii CBS 4309]CCC68415.1 hypothetical protein NCAS_0B03310 [Naumovozyma castellii CBS 4309]